MIVPWGGPGLEIGACLASLAAQSCSFPFDVIVVDAAPALGRVLALPEGVRRVDAPRALPPGAARNAGAAATPAKMLAFLDSDCVAEPRWLEQAVAALGDGRVLVGGPVGDVLPWHPIAAIDNLLQFAEQGPRRRSGNAAYFPACSMATTADVFGQCSGFPETMPVGEDVAFCLSVAARHPGGLRFVREMRIRHLGRRSLPAFVAHQISFGWARAVTGYFLPDWARRLGRHAWAIPLVAGKRFLFLLHRTIAVNPPALLRIVCFFPVLGVGLIGWAYGFHAGCREVHADESARGETVGGGQRE